MKEMSDFPYDDKEYVFYTEIGFIIGVVNKNNDIVVKASGAVIKTAKYFEDSSFLYSRIPD